MLTINCFDGALNKLVLEVEEGVTNYQQKTLFTQPPIQTQCIDQQTQHRKFWNVETIDQLANVAKPINDYISSTLMQTNFTCEEYPAVICLPCNDNTYDIIKTLNKINNIVHANCGLVFNKFAAVDKQLFTNIFETFYTIARGNPSTGALMFDHDVNDAMINWINNTAKIEQYVYKFFNTEQHDYQLYYNIAIQLAGLAKLLCVDIQSIEYENQRIVFPYIDIRYCL